MAFKKLRGVNIPAKKQLLIRAICLNYDDRPKWEQKKIERLCDACGGGHSAALFETMTTEKSIPQISMQYFVSETVLYDIRKKFYERWTKE